MQEVNVPRSKDVFKLENGYYHIDKKNVLAKITSDENALKYKLYESDAEQTLWIQIETHPKDCGLIGSECCNSWRIDIVTNLFARSSAGINDN